MLDQPIRVLESTMQFLVLDGFQAGLSWAIIAMVGVVVMVLAGAVAFFVQAARKSNLVQAADDATSLIEKS